MHTVTNLAIKNIHPKWLAILNSPTTSGKTLIEILDDTLTTIVGLNKPLSPNSPDKILRCLQIDPDLIKVVIVGPGVYSEPNVATGLLFAGEKLMPDLNVILNGLAQEYSFPESDNFDTSLKSWEDQGVLLLNSSLSCEQFRPESHSKLWESFISNLIKQLSDFKLTQKHEPTLVFVFIGEQAQLYHIDVNENFHYKVMRYFPQTGVHSGEMFIGFGKEVNKYLDVKINWI